jgi:acyl-homoserine lactone acylase PvdQ
MRIELRRVLPCILYAASAFGQADTTTTAEEARWKRHASAITIVRDDWGIAHVYGKTDADTVFGAIYAQAEDDFNRIETNYLNSLGRLAEAEGEQMIWKDLRMRMFLDTAALKEHYASSPPWLRALMNAWADGLNYFLARHSHIQPRVLRRFEPWMALSFTEGSIGGDIESIAVGGIREFYSARPTASSAGLERQSFMREHSGSNGFAIAPSNTMNRRALLLINPHTTFFFRSELHMVSEEGLNAYGAATWGQFFIYQGFNDRAGWMHTSSNVDVIDEYVETVVRQDGRLFYKRATEIRPVDQRVVTLRYKRAGGGLGHRKFTVYRTHHGPVIRRQAQDRWVAASLMVKPIEALSESYLRTKARSYRDYLKTMELKANSSNNTVYADADGNIAYFHGNFIPRRNTSFDYTKPVDGANPAADWNGLHELEETPHLLNPASGWLYNTNNWPWSAAGPNSPKRSDYPAYMEEGAENSRGIHAIRVLENRMDFTFESLMAAAYDSYMPWFERPVQEVVAAWNSLPISHPLKARLQEQAAALGSWDLRWSSESVPTALGMFWAAELKPGRFEVYTPRPQAVLLTALDAASRKLTADFGTWKTAWGQVNRFQRLTGGINQPFNDNAPSVAVPFTTGAVGSLATFAARPYPGTKRWYGTSGNSFVAVVEFGRDRVRARAITAGGESGDPTSKHFNDQAQRYATGSLRDVYFYRDELKGHTEREYHP